LAAAAAAIVGAVVSKRLSEPIEKMRAGAKHFAQGKFDYRLPMSDTEELAELGEALEQMAKLLCEQIRQINLQRNELVAVLSSMVEGVVAVDANERILSMNRAAGEMLGIIPEKAKGKTIQEVIRNTVLQKFVTSSMAGKGTLEDVFDMRIEGEERFFQVHGAPLMGSDDTRTGAVIVLNDVTHLKKLENVRREFVANVSHELRTPITTVKGFVETLLDGAINDQDKSLHFLDIISKHIDRLNAIINDLLLLSDVEHAETEEKLSLGEEKVEKVLQAAVDACKGKAYFKNIDVRIEAEEGLVVRMSAPLMEQAVANLIDNAIKYSESGKSVVVKAHEAEGEVIISVT